MGKKEGLNIEKEAERFGISVDELEELLDLDPFALLIKAQELVKYGEGYNSYKSIDTLYLVAQLARMQVDMGGEYYTLTQDAEGKEKVALIDPRDIHFSAGDVLSLAGMDGKSVRVSNGIMKHRNRMLRGACGWEGRIFSYRFEQNPMEKLAGGEAIIEHDEGHSNTLIRSRVKQNDPFYRPIKDFAERWFLQDIRKSMERGRGRVENLAYGWPRTIMTYSYSTVAMMEIQEYVAEVLTEELGYMAEEVQAAFNQVVVFSQATPVLLNNGAKGAGLDGEDMPTFQHVALFNPGDKISRVFWDATLGWWLNRWDPHEDGPFLPHLDHRERSYALVADFGDVGYGHDFKAHNDPKLIPDQALQALEYAARRGTRKLTGGELKELADMGRVVRVLLEGERKLAEDRTKGDRQKTEEVVAREGMDRDVLLDFPWYDHNARFLSRAQGAQIIQDVVRQAEKFHGRVDALSDVLSLMGHWCMNQSGLPEKAENWCGLGIKMIDFAERLVKIGSVGRAIDGKITITPPEEKTIALAGQKIEMDALVGCAADAAWQFNATTHLPTWVTEKVFGERSHRGR